MRSLCRTYLQAAAKAWPIREAHLEEARDAAYRGNWRTVVSESETVIPHPVADCGIDLVASMLFLHGFTPPRSKSWLRWASLSQMRRPWRGGMWCCIAGRVRVQTAGRVQVLASQRRCARTHMVRPPYAITSCEGHGRWVLSAVSRCLFPSQCCDVSLHTSSLLGTDAQRKCALNRWPRWAWTGMQAVIDNWPPSERSPTTFPSPLNWCIRENAHGAYPANACRF